MIFLSPYVTLKQSDEFSQNKNMNRLDYIKRIHTYHSNNPLKSGTIVSAWHTDSRWKNLSDEQIKSLYLSFVPFNQRVIWFFNCPLELSKKAAKPKAWKPKTLHDIV
jgi:hypothetical protein